MQKSNEPDSTEVILRDWARGLCSELDLDESVDVATLLDLARIAAHNVARPAAPVTTFLVGLAAGRAGGTEADVSEATEAAMRLARSWKSTHAE